MGASENGASTPRDDVPVSAELFDVLAEHLSGMQIANVVIEGVAVVGDLRGTIPSSHRPDQLRQRAGPGGGPAGRQERRPAPWRHCCSVLIVCEFTFVLRFLSLRRAVL
jgi:hypothetical protein